jgi:hypothetical protein
VPNEKIKFPKWELEGFEKNGRYLDEIPAFAGMTV